MATSRKTHRAPRAAILGGPASVVETACPLDCPDACSLAVTVQHGKVIAIDGSHRNPVTDGYICAKVRKFGERVYGPDRLLYPAVRTGRKGEGQFKRVPGTRRSSSSSTRFRRAKAEHGGASILPVFVRRIERPADAGQPRRAALAPFRHVAPRAHGLRRADRRREHGALRQDAVGHLPGLSRGEADHPVGREPVRVGHPPRPVRARGAEARRQARRRRSAHDGAGAIGRRASGGQAGHRRRRRARDPPAPVRERPAPTRRSCASTRAARTSCASAPSRGRSSARPKSPASTRRRSSASRSSMRTSSPALIRCGWGLERNRNGGNAAMAVLALPAVGGKFGVRGGGYSMSNSASWDIERTWIGAAEPDTRIVNMNHLGRALTEYDDPPVNVLFVYNCNPAATVPGSAPRPARARARGSVHRRVRAGDDRHGALRRRRAAGDDVPRGLRLREGVRADQPRSRAAGDRRRSAKRGRTPTCSASSARASACCTDDEPTGELDLMVHVLDELPGTIGDDLRDGVAPAPPFGAAPGPVRRRLPEHAGSQGRSVPRGARRDRRRWASTASSPIRRPSAIRWRSSRRRASARSARRSASCRGRT